MKILVDLYHPAHLHLFRNAMKILEERGHTIIWVTRDKDITVQLLQEYKLPFKVLTKAKKGLWNMFWELVIHDYKVWYEAIKNDVDLMLGTSVSITHAALFCKAKSWVFEEDDAKQAKLMTYLSYPFASKIITPDFLAHEKHGKKHITYPSYHELAYLHPNNYQPNPDILDELGLKVGENYFIMRFVSLNASHDFGVQGLSLENKKVLLHKLLQHGKVFITSEAELDEEFEPYRLRMAPHRMHDLLAYSTLCIGDSQTMAIEAAVLGVPALRCNSFVGELSLLKELDDKYGLTFGFLPNEGDALLAKIDTLLAEPKLKELWQEKLKIFLDDKIDMTEWLIEYIESQMTN
jgi:predicted glycosyltransferase